MAEKERNDTNTGKSEGKPGHGKRILLRTFGCQMNVRDSEVIKGLLNNSGLKFTDDPQQADVVVFNTCSVRQHAEDKVWSEVGRIAKQAEKKPLIGVVGCMAQNYQDRVFERAPAVDFVVGPSDIHKIPSIIRRLLAAARPSKRYLFERKIWETEGGVRPEDIYHTGFREDKRHAFVVISEGCSNFCSYCVVPYVRGPLRSRSHKDILKEIEEAVEGGATSVTLLGQNVNAYQDGGVDFIRLLGLVNDVDGLKEFSFVTSHPKDTSTRLFRAMADCEKLKKHLHLPVQAGSDRILKLMNRGYTGGFYLQLAKEYRSIVQGGSLTTDVIVGFPTESKADFLDTYELVKTIQFNAAYIFKYSPRPRTEAARLPDDVPKEEKEKRHQAVLALQKKISKSLAGLAGVLLLVASLYSPSFAFYNLQRLKLSMLEGDYKAAIAEGEKILGTLKDQAHADELYYLLGVSYLKDGNYLRASDIFEIIIKEFKGSPFGEKAKVGLGDTYLLRGDLESAGRLYKEVLSSGCSQELKASLYYRLAQVGFAKGESAEAQEYLRRLKTEFPMSPELKEGQSTAALPDPGPDLRYTVQVGSFVNSSNARNLCARLIEKGYDAYLEEAVNRDKKIYRVKVGRFKNRSDAAAMEKVLSAEGYPTKIFP